MPCARPAAAIRYRYIASKQAGEVIDISGARVNPDTPLIAFPRNAPPSDNQLGFIVPEMYELRPGVLGGPGSR
jgi:hypothetical protein